MLEFQNKTFDWDGWRFTVVGNKITARPIVNDRPPGVDLEFYYPDERNDMVIRRGRQIMTAVNIGAYMKAYRIRRELGVENQCGKASNNLVGLSMEPTVTFTKTLRRGYEPDTDHN